MMSKNIALSNPSDIPIQLLGVLPSSSVILGALIL